MTDAMDALYSYAQGHTLKLFLAEEECYQIYLYHEDQYTERLRAALEESNQQLLDRLLRTETNILIAESRAYFQAGFRAALDLIL